MKSAVIMVLGMCVFATGITFIADGFTRYQCSKYEEITGKETKMSFADSCYVKQGGEWQRWDEYKARSTASSAVLQYGADR